MDNLDRALAPPLALPLTAHALPLALRYPHSSVHCVCDLRVRLRSAFSLCSGSVKTHKCHLRIST